MSSAPKHPCDEEFIRSTRAEAPCARKAGPWVLMATILGSSMAFIDETATKRNRRSSPTTWRPRYLPSEECGWQSGKMLL
jgi:hypothetical protein